GPAPSAAGFNEVGVGKGRLRILVQVLHVRMGRSAVEVEVVLLDVLPVVTFAVGQPKETFLENRILAVPQGNREAEPLLIIRHAGQAVFAPAIGTRAGLVVGEVIPGISPFAVVLAYGAPLPLAQVRSPLLPGHFVLASLLESNVFCGHRSPASFR